MRKTLHMLRKMVSMLLMACLLMGAFAVIANAEAALTCGEDHEHTADCYAAHTAGEGEEAIPAEAPETIEVLACTAIHDHTADCYEVWRLTCTEDHEHSQTIGDGCYTLEMAALPYVFNYNMSEFVPNTNYGLHVLTGNDQPASLNNWTFRAEEEFVLRADFRVVAPVDPGKEYTYALPKALVGRDPDPDQQPQPIIENANFGTAWVDVKTSELKIVFTQEAAEYVHSAGALNFKYDFRQALNMVEIGDAQEAVIRLYRKGAYDDIKIIIARDDVPVVERSVTVERDMPDILHYGDTFTMKATLVGFEDVDVDICWQRMTEIGWIEIEGEGLELPVVADENNVNCDWRILVSILG